VAEGHRENRRYIVSLVIVAGIVADMLWCSHYERQQEIERFSRIVRQDDVAQAKQSLQGFTASVQL